MYFLIHCSEDGDVSVDKYEKDALLLAIKENYYGDIGFFDKMPDGGVMYWGNRVLIIKGEIVIPKPVEVVKKYEI